MEQCLAAIEVADYIAIDMEFSGLFSSAKKCAHLDEYYSHLGESVRKFLCVQLGVCCARKKSSPQDAAAPPQEASPETATSPSSSSLEWSLDPFNFYVFPSRRKIHSVDTSSLAFLKSQGFDFNDWIERGYDYDRLANITCPYIRTRESITTVGLQRVVEKIIDSQKPVIFHNGVLDVAHLYDKFIADLPESLGEFAQELKELFPGGIYDTKRIAVECNLVPRTLEELESAKHKYTLDGISSALSAFEGRGGGGGELSKSEPSSSTAGINPLLGAPVKSARPSYVPSYGTTGAFGGAASMQTTSHTALNVLRRTLEKKLGRHLKLKVEPNVTTSYDLKLRILPSELSPEIETTTEPSSPGGGEQSSSPNKRARIDPLQASREHEAGFDAMLTMHLFLLELEILLNKTKEKIEWSSNGANLIASTSMVKAQDKLDCKGIPPGYMDLADARSRAVEGARPRSNGSSGDASKREGAPPSASDLIMAPLFKNKTL